MRAGTRSDTQEQQEHNMQLLQQNFGHRHASCLHVAVKSHASMLATSVQAKHSRSSEVGRA
jgi:hypothetical protein